MSRRPHVIVIGAGAFGGWTALELARCGARVTLMDAWGPGNARASSGGETRIIRATYGSRAIYTELTLRALELWRAFDAIARDGTELLRETGVLWLFRDDDSYGRTSAEVLRGRGGALDEMPKPEAIRLFPQINWTDVRSVYLERDAGYLLARQACQSVKSAMMRAGGEYRNVTVVSPVSLDDLRAKRVALHGGVRIEADAFVFACGPWLGSLLPDVIGRLITPTRQEVLYFGTPVGDTRFTQMRLPVWIDFGDRQIYGIPGDGTSGFKVADDRTGPEIDPTAEERRASDDGIAAMRAFVAHRFPALANAPLVAAEVCQYESSPDAHFIIDRHPALDHVWIAGGGSGHGFKMGPVVGEMVASLVLGDATPDPRFSLARFASPPVNGWEHRWS
jgi:glycine/D-amino acid oxidase-like deaminating enzyme